MSAEKFCYWLMGAVFLLSMFLVFIIGRNYQGKVVDDLIEQNQKAVVVFKETEKGLQQIAWNRSAAQYWVNLGYNVKVPEEVKKSEEVK